MNGKIYAIHCDFVDYVATRQERIASLDAKAMDTAMEAATGRSNLVVSNGTAIINVKGIMEKIAYWSDEVSTLRVRRELAEAANAKKVSSIMLSVDSPGGTVDGIAELSDAILNAGKSKPVIAQVEGSATSAAYWAVSQAGSIVANKLDKVGSIGVRMILMDTSKLYEADGVETVVLDTGEHKSTGAPGTPVTDNQRAELQRMVDVFFGAFKDDIMRGRRGSGLSRAALDKLADGRIFIGQEAVENKLIDGIKSSDQTLAELRRTATNRKQRIEDERKRLSLQASLAQKL
jgi:signal peptide peptidase SppA